MQIDKDDRYVSDASHKASTPSKKSSILKQLLKPRALILILVVALLMLIFIMSLSLNKEDTSWVVPPKINKIQPMSSVNDNQDKNGDSTLPSSTTPSSALEKPVSTPPTTDKPVEIQPQPIAGTPAEIATRPVAEKPAEQKPVEEKSQPAKIETSAKTTPLTVNNKPATAVQPTKEQQTVTANHPNTKQQTTVSNKNNEKLLIANNRFSIQLVGSTSLENVRRLISQYNIKNAHIYETQRNDKPWYVLLQGDYPSIEAARAAIKSLPEEFQKNKAWAKAGAVINKEMSMVPNQPTQPRANIE